MVVMCYIASMTVFYIGLGMIQLNMFRPIPNIPSSKACNALGNFISLLIKIRNILDHKRVYWQSLF